MSSKQTDSCVQRVMHSKSDNIEIMSHNKERSYWRTLWITSFEISNWFGNIKERERFNHCVNLLYYKCHKINFYRCGSYKDSLDCIKKKKWQWTP